MVALHSYLLIFYRKHEMAITLDATSRTDLGRGASRRLRREFKTPAIIIGEGKDALSITLDEKKVINASLRMSSTKK